MNDPDSEAVLAYWFGEALAGDAPMAFWFSADAARDEHIRSRFGALVQAALAGQFDAWAHTPRGRLSLLILLDQFTRNMYRGTAQAFAGDLQARALALEGIARGDDQQLDFHERAFCYMPLEHAEDDALQARSVALFERLRDDVPPAQRAPFAHFLDYARQHADVIATYGRFPHRNAALGRISTAAEEEYLRRPDAGF